MKNETVIFVYEGIIVRTEPAGIKEIAMSISRTRAGRAAAVDAIKKAFKYASHMEDVYGDEENRIVQRLPATKENVIAAGEAIARAYEVARKAAGEAEVDLLEDGRYVVVQSYREDLGVRRVDDQDDDY